MQKIIIFFVLTTLAFSAPGVFESPGRIGISTKTTAISFSRHTGEIESIVDIPSGTDLANEGGSTALLRGTLTKFRQGKTQKFSAADFEDISLSARDGTILIVFAKCKLVPISVRVTVSAASNELIAFSAEVVNKSDWALAELVLPTVAIKQDIGISGDTLVMPWGNTGILPNFGAQKYASLFEYPGIMVAQFLARTGATAGLYLATYDPRGHCKAFGVTHELNEPVYFYILHRLPENVRPAFSLTYQTVLTTFQGDWRTAAGIYKRWAVNQPWCKKKLFERVDIPQAVKSPCMGVVAQVNRHHDLVGTNIVRIPALMNNYRDAAGISNVLCFVWGWENHGQWAGINYFPARPSEEQWRQVSKGLISAGNAAAFLISGFYWVTKRQASAQYGPAFDDSEDFEARKDMCIKNTDGSVKKIDYYNNPLRCQGLQVELCHGSVKAQEVMKNIFLKAADLGITFLSFDQENGGRQAFPCYDESHGHEPGYGDYMYRGFRDTCISILREKKPGQIGLCIENASEIMIPYMSMYYAREYVEIPNSGGGNARGAGIFSYIYHEYIPCIGAELQDGQSGPKSVNPEAIMRCRIIANCLVRGLIPAPQMIDAPLPNHPEFEQMEWRQKINKAYPNWYQMVTNALFSYSKVYTAFPEYVTFGESVPPPSVESKTIELPIFIEDQNTGTSKMPGLPPVVQKTISAAAVIAGAFRSTNGNVASFIVNATPDPQTAVVLLDANVIGGVYSAKREQEKTATERTTLHLEPFGVRVIVTKCQ